MKHLHIIGLSLLFYGLLGFFSCSSDTAGLLREGGDDRDILLTFRTAVAGASTRAGEDNGDDHVGTLRIVIVSKGKGEGAGWTVEHNSKFSPTAQEYSFKVAPDSKKRIYLIANEDGLVDAGRSALDFSDASFIPQDGNGKAAVDDYVFVISEEHPYTPSALPMSAVYEFDVPAADKITNGTYQLPKTLYLVRAATKFSFEFTNQSTERAITVTGIDVSQVVTDKMYLMPHVKTKNGKYWVVEETKAEGGSTYTERSLDNQDWVDWMGEEAEKSKSNNDDEWLTDYEKPNGATSKKYEFKTELKMEKSTGVELYPKVEAPNAFYLPESRTEKGDGNEFHLQEYSITVHTTENESEWSGELTYLPVTLPHLSSLFRNTHVVVSATFTDKEIVYEVDVIPFSDVNLAPDMGLERDDFTGYIVGKDSLGNDCWYDLIESPNNPAERTPLYLGPKGQERKFVEINGKDYLLVYTDFERTARNLDHIFEKDENGTPIKHLLSPEGRTGYVKSSGDVEGVQTEWYQTKLKRYVWLDEGGDPEGSEEEQKVYETLKTLGLRGRRILYEWDRWDWDKAIVKKDLSVRPKYWYDVLGNRYLWSIGDYGSIRDTIIGEWVDYLPD